MRTLLAFILATAMLSGCGFYRRYVVANVVGYDKTCVDGVIYLQFPSGVAMQVNETGSPVRCR